MAKMKIGLLIGSTREERLCDRVTLFVSEAVKKNHEVTIFDPNDMDLPRSQQSINFLFDPSASKVPQNIKDLNEKVKTMDGFVIISPEYNWSLPPGLTNMMDNIPPTTWCWKPCAFVHYSVSPIGGWRVGMQLRVFAAALGLMTVPKQIGIPVVHTALTNEGTTTNEALQGELTTMLGQLYWAIEAFRAHSNANPPPPWSM